jgi:glutamate-1-semialdehyde 2,1-aminomutase
MSETGAAAPDAHKERTMDQVVNTDVNDALDEAKAHYARNNPKSGTLYETALKSLPGGNTRTGVFYEPFPVMFERGEGARLWDADGHEYRDFVCEQTAAIYGHNHPVIREAVVRRLDLGWNLGGHTSLEGEFADILTERFPSMERVRFVNSGTEANMFALQLARNFTDRPAVLGFQGCYHGGFLTFAAKTNPMNMPYETVVATYNDIDGTAALIEANAQRLACVILEPMIGSGGCIPATVQFLSMLREKTRTHGILLMFDEVMTSRLGPGGLQAITGVIPDLTSLGKYIGGGFSAGAFGGRAEIMDRFDPRRTDALPHSGTYNNNVFTLSAGIAGLRSIYTAEAAVALNARGEALRLRLNQAIEKTGVAMQFTGIGSMMSVHMHRGTIRSPADAAQSIPKLRELFCLDMLAQGIYVTPKRGGVILSLPHSDADGDALVGAVEEFIAARRSLLG